MFIKVSGTSDWQQEGIKKVSTSNVYKYIINFHKREEILSRSDEIEWNGRGWIDGEL